MKIKFLLMVGFIIAASQVFAANGELLVEGKAGIGTTTPVGQLDVQGTSLFRLGSIYLNSNVVTANNYQRFALGYGIYWDSANNNYKVTDPTYNQATFSNENGRFVWTLHTGALTSPQTYADWRANDKMVLSYQGNLGLGTSAPTSRFQIVGSSDLRTPGGDGDSVMRLSNSYYTAFGSGPEIQFGLSSATPGSSVLSLIKGTYSAYTSTPYFGGDLTFHTRTAVDGSLNERLRITSTGKVGIGTGSPTSQLQVVGLPAYANNAAAKAGGLTAGAFYRTGGDPDVVCVVH